VLEELQQRLRCVLLPVDPEAEEEGCDQDGHGERPRPDASVRSTSVAESFAHLAL
jgi:hypothetical protein